MSPVIVDVGLAGRLANFGQPVDLCDPSGRVIGRFEPISDISQWEPVEPDLENANDLRRRFQSGEKGFSLTEVLEHLRKLP